MYRLCLLLLILLTVLVRSLFIETFPFGFPQHAVAHAQLRVRLYNTIFVNPWTAQSWPQIKSIVIQDQHGPQSLIEACLTPIFGFGFTESRLIVGLLGLLGVALICKWGTVAVNKWFGLVAGLVLGITPYFLHFSRNGDTEHVNIYWHAFLLLLAAQWVVARGWFRDYILLGIATGLSLYVYATNQFFSALVVPLVLLTKLVQRFTLKDSPTWPAFLRGLSCIGASLIVAAPLLAHYIQVGRTIPLRTPYVVQDQKSPLTYKLEALWRELFVRGSDPWFARPEGCLTDWSLLLLIPGIIMMLGLARTTITQLHEAKASPNQHSHGRIIKSYSTIFMLIVTITLVMLGSIPGILSHEPAFRRVVLVAIGLDIIRAFGVYGIILLILRVRPKILAYGITLVLVCGFTFWQWQAFFYDSHAQESNSTHSLTAVIREIRKQIETGKKVFVLLPENRLLLNRDEALFFLNFQLGYPKELPANLTILDIESLVSEPNDVIVPFDTTRKILSGQIPLTKGVVATNVRNFADRGGGTFSLIDFARISTEKHSGID